MKSPYRAGSDSHAYHEAQRAKDHERSVTCVEIAFVVILFVGTLVLAAFLAAAFPEML